MSTTVDLGKITASVTVGTTTTGAAGTNASVSNSGTTQDAVLNFTIPRGAQGVQGQQGSTGPAGPAGPTGPQGPMGDVAVITPEQQAAFTMYSVPGQNTDGPMTQKAVTDNLFQIVHIVKPNTILESVGVPVIFTKDDVPADSNIEYDFTAQDKAAVYFMVLNAAGETLGYFGKGSSSSTVYDYSGSFHLPSNYDRVELRGARANGLASVLVRKLCVTKRVIPVQEQLTDKYPISSYKPNYRIIPNIWNEDINTIGKYELAFNNITVPTYRITLGNIASASNQYQIGLVYVTPTALASNDTYKIVFGVYSDVSLGTINLTSLNGNKASTLFAPPSITVNAGWNWCEVRCQVNQAIAANTTMRLIIARNNTQLANKTLYITGAWLVDANYPVSPRDFILDRICINTDDVQKKQFLADTDDNIRQIKPTIWNPTVNTSEDSVIAINGIKTKVSKVTFGDVSTVSNENIIGLVFTNTQAMNVGDVFNYYIGIYSNVFIGTVSWFSLPSAGAFSIALLDSFNIQQGWNVIRIRATVTTTIPAGSNVRIVVKKTATNLSNKIIYMPYAYVVLGDSKCSISDVNYLALLKKLEPERQILVNGDSITLSWGGNSFGAAIQAKTGITTISYGIGGEPSRVITARDGAIPMYASGMNTAQGNYSFTLPANTSPVEVQLWDEFLESRMNVREGSATSGCISYLLLDGIKVVLTISGTVPSDDGTGGGGDYSNVHYYLARETTGQSAITYTKPMRLTPRASVVLRNYIPVTVMGANDQLGSGDYQEKIDKIVARFKAINAHHNTDEWFVIRYAIGSAECNEAMRKRFFDEFGYRCIDLQEFLIKYGLGLLGLTPTAEDLEDIANGIPPRQLRQNAATHHLTNAAQVIACEYVADRVNYFLNNV